MTGQQMSNLVMLIAERVYGDTGNVTLGSTPGCGPVKLQIGFINKVVQHDGIVITDAPADITELVMSWVAEQKKLGSGGLVSASPGYGGLFIR